MSLVDALAIAVRTLADWADDRLTIAAIGLATGYFGLSDAQWTSLTGLIVAAASALLVLIPDPRKKAIAHDSQPITVVGRAAAPADFVRPTTLPSHDDLRPDSDNEPGHNG